MGRKSILSVREKEAPIFYSKESQDKFVHFLLHRLLEMKEPGHFLDIGAYHPMTGNNTYFFEKNFGWKGVSIDISDRYAQEWYAVRKNPLLIEDATKVDYDALLASLPTVIDYLSLDVDGVYDTVLERIPFSQHVFKVITIEHDYYRFGPLYRNQEREILKSHGYYLLCPDVTTNNAFFEDWWVHPSAFPADTLSKLQALDLHGKDHTHLIHTFESKL